MTIGYTVLKRIEEALKLGIGEGAEYAAVAEHKVSCAYWIR